MALVVFVIVTLSLAGSVAWWLNRRVSKVGGKGLQMMLRITLWAGASIAFLVLVSPLFLTSK